LRPHYIKKQVNLGKVELFIAECIRNIINAICKENAEFLDVEVAGTYSCALKGFYKYEVAV
jgi:hypothetical protein